MHSVYCACILYQVLYVPHSLFGFEGGMWGLLVLVPGYCLSIYFPQSSYAG